MSLYSGYNDEELLALLRNDDEEAFDALYEKYHHALYLNVMRTIRSTIEAEDIIQEIFYTLWQKRHLLEPKMSIGGWLFTVSYHQTVDHLRRKIKQENATLQFYQIKDSLTEAESLEVHYELIEEAIQMLSPKKRQVFELCKLQGKTYEKAAVELGISKYTVNEYLKDAMAIIRKYVKEQPMNSSFLISTAVFSTFFR